MSTAEVHDHPEFLAHHWDNPKQQFEAGKLGMWLFLATEILLFGGLFCAYVIWRYLHPEMFKFGSQFLDTTMGAINTAVLILSSLTMATAVTMAQKGKQKELVVCLVLTLLGAFGFLTIKYFEYTHKFHEGFFPGLAFYENHEHAESWDEQLALSGVQLTEIDPAARALTPEQMSIPAEVTVEPSTVGPAGDSPEGMSVAALATMEDSYAKGLGEQAHEDEGGHAHPVHPMQDPNRPANAHMFFNIYFMMTGLHGVHVLMGGVMLVWLLVKALRRQFNADYFTPVDLGGLYWHVVDLIWIFLFPLFYLI